MQLAEAVALGFATPSQVVGDAYDEYREERQRPQSPPPGRRCREQGGGDSKLCQGKHQPEGGGYSRWYSEVDYGLPRAFEVRKLCNSSQGEHCSKHKAGY